ncbi:MAG: hypothetical protein EB060_07035 [Proteobacteria bacterium]|nr:hypothetical protein [Pseudomonadota bacterium]
MAEMAQGLRDMLAEPRNEQELAVLNQARAEAGIPPYDPIGESLAYLNELRAARGEGPYELKVTPEGPFDELAHMELDDETQREVREADKRHLGLEPDASDELVEDVRAAANERHLDELRDAMGDQGKDLDVIADELKTAMRETKSPFKAEDKPKGTDGPDEGKPRGGGRTM